MSDNVLTADDLALINEPHLGFVATVMADGSPQITPVWVDSDGENLRFNTARGRVKRTTWNGIRTSPCSWLTATTPTGGSASAVLPS